MENITQNPQNPTVKIVYPEFPRFINNLGIIPSSYKDSMSYYETLAWFCKFLEETLLPALNTNQEAVEELQNLYKELNDYVSNYFDSTDFNNQIITNLENFINEGKFDSILSSLVDEKIEEINSKLQTINQKLEENTSNINNLNKNVSNMETNISNLESKNLQLTSYTKIINRLSNQNFPLLVAHRGVSFEAPENSFPAFEIAREKGFNAIETDIRESADGVYFCSHDNDLSRMTNAPVGTNISDSTEAQILQYDIDAGQNVAVYDLYFNNTWNKKTPKLDEFLQICEIQSVIPVIEVKSIKDQTKFFNYLKNKNILDKAIFLIADVNLAKALRQFSPPSIIWRLSNELSEEIIQECANEQFGISVPVNIATSELFNICKQYSVHLNTWSINSEDSRLYARQLNPDSLTIDGMFWFNEVSMPLTRIGNFKVYNNGEIEQMSRFSMCSQIDPSTGDTQFFNFPLLVRGFNNNNFYLESWSPVNNRYIVPIIIPVNNYKYIKLKQLIKSKTLDFNYTVRCYDINGNALNDIGWVTTENKALPENTAFLIFYISTPTNVNGSWIAEQIFRSYAFVLSSNN